MSESLLLSTEQKSLEGAKGWSVRAFEIRKKENAGFDGIISLEPPNGLERIHINWTAVYQGEGNWRFINKRNSTTILHELRSVNTALQAFITEGLNDYRSSCRVISQPAEMPPPPRVDPEDTDTAKSAEPEYAHEEIPRKKRERPKSPLPEHAEKRGCQPSTLSDAIRHRLAYSVKEAAEILGISEKTIRRLVVSGELHVSRKIRHLIIPKTELERLLSEATPSATSQTQVGSISILKTGQKENESDSERVPMEQLLHLLSEVKATGVVAVDDVGELTRFIEFFRGILPAKKYTLKYQLDVNKVGQTGALIELRPVK